MEHVPDKSIEIKKIAMLLSDSELLKKKNWHRLACQFFDRYRPDLEGWYGEDGEADHLALVPLREEQMLIDFLGGMHKAGFFGECTRARLAWRLNRCFAFRLSPNTLEDRLRKAEEYAFRAYLKGYEEIYQKKFDK